MKKSLTALLMLTVMLSVAVCPVGAIAEQTVANALLSEDFENAVAGGSSFVGADSSYTITYDFDKKINGKMSALSPSNITGYSLFMQTDSRLLVLGAKQKCSVLAKVKVTEAFVGDGNFYIEVGADGDNFRYLRIG